MTREAWMLTLLSTFCLAALIVVAQEQPVKFALSETEELKRQNLILKHELLQCQINTNTTSYQEELNRYIFSTLEAHGKPDNVIFNSQSMQFQVTQDKVK